MSNEQHTPSHTPEAIALNYITTQTGCDTETAHKLVELLKEAIAKAKGQS